MLAKPNKFASRNVCTPSSFISFSTGGSGPQKRPYASVASQCLQHPSAGRAYAGSIPARAGSGHLCAGLLETPIASSAGRDTTLSMGICACAPPLGTFFALREEPTARRTPIFTSVAVLVRACQMPPARGPFFVSRWCCPASWGSLS